MKCPNCGADLTENVKFCPKCGMPVAGQDRCPAPVPTQEGARRQEVRPGNRQDRKNRFP